MKLLRAVLFGTFSILLLGSILSLVLPSHGHCEVVFLIREPPALVLHQTMTPKLVAQWNPFSRSSQDVPFRFGGPASGPRAFYTWSDPLGSRGTFQVTGVYPNREVNFSIRIRNREESGSFELRPAAGGQQTLVKWIIDYQAGILPWDRFYALAFGTIMGPAMNSGAAALKKQCGDSGPD